MVGPLQVAALLSKRRNKDGKRSELLAQEESLMPNSLTADPSRENAELFLSNWNQAALPGRHGGFSGKEGDERSCFRGVAVRNNATQTSKWLLVAEGRGG